MSKPTPEEFLELVVKSNLVEPSKLDRFIEKVKAKCDGHLPISCRKFAMAFERAGLLTHWHIEKLAAGKYKGFFLGKYKLLGHIGSGGMSSVYLAQHAKLGHQRAIKVLPKHRVKDASYLARFQLEAKAIASLNHPNIVLAHDIDQQDDVHYIVMEYVDGVDMQILVRRDGPLDPSTAAELLGQAARGLAHAHSRGVIHRDVKPANLLIDSKGVVRLLDMGLALVADEGEESLTVAHNENVLGTADYLAPEQAINSHTVDHRADIYGLGCTLYFLLTGKPPFAEGTLAQRLAKHQNEMPKSIRALRPECPGELEGICIKMMQKDRKFRYQTATEVAEALEKFAVQVPKGEPVRVVLGEPPQFDLNLSSLSFSGSSSGSGSLGTNDRFQTDQQAEFDTVTNQNGDTLASSRSKLIREQNEAASSSGRLVDIAPRLNAADLISGSFLDLEVESGYQKSTRPLSSSLSGTAAISAQEPDDIRTLRPTRKRNRRKSVDRMLIGAVIVALFVGALALGFFLAKVTA